MTRGRALLASVLLFSAAMSGCGESALRASNKTIPETIPEARIARTPDDAVFTIDCTFSHRAKDDPIVRPGEFGAAHSHDFFGNTSTDAASTLRTLEGQSTTCEDSRDRASYWVPTLSVAGVAVEPTLLRAYYRAVPGADVASVQAPPAGLEMLAGDPHATSPQPTREVGWGCGLRPRALRPAPPTDCTPISPLTMQLFFPDCWDGSRLDSPDHRDHVATSDDGHCPPSHPVTITQLQVSVQWPVHGPAGAIALSSGQPVTAHGDFVNAWDQAYLEHQVKLCVHAKANCTIG